jgi:copper chaperone NosL
MRPAPISRVALVAGTVTALVATGCARPSSDEPPKVHYGEDPCSECRMIVSEERFATAVVAELDGLMETHAFDDVGCQLRWEASRDHGVVRARWVHDHATGEWLRAEEAHFVHGADIRSPMGSGVLARATHADAATEAERRGGVVMTWTELQAGAGGLTTPPLPAGSP